MSEQTMSDIEHIAVIGMAGKFPKANTIKQFWENLRNGTDCSTQFSDDELRQKGLDEESINSPEYVKSGMVLENIDLFDAEFFGYNAKEAQTMDPQQRIFLELAWSALEDAGCSPDFYDGSIGVFGGTGTSDYVKRIPANQNALTSGFDSFQAMMGNDVDFLTTRVSYKLNLTGPSFTLQTACSTSLVAIHMACQHLFSYQCDIALAGGVSIRLPQDIGYMYRDGMIWSPDGTCRAFDAQSQGTVFGRGAGVVVLKRLSEAIAEKDHIYAVIKGTAINNDGALKVGYTAPSVEGQSQVISLAQGLSNTTADTIDYIEAHGTGTPLGDPIEIEALTEAFRADTQKNGFCAIGSVKTSIGHLDIAAGVAGFIKTVLALQHKEIPPSLHFEKPNPNIDFENSPFYVADKLHPWPKTESPRRAGVSAFGIGGTNAHVILEEAPDKEEEKSSRNQQLLLLTAKSEDALNALCDSYITYFQENPETSLADTAYTLTYGRTHFKHKRAIVSSSTAETVKILQSKAFAPMPVMPKKARKNSIVFLFSGQGSQYINMCREIYEEEPFFKEQIDTCAEALTPHLDLDIRSIIFPETDGEEEKNRINQTYLTQPALFVIEYAIARLLMHWGVTPKAMVGHSIGEYVAACLAGVFSLNDALALVAARGRMMQDLESGSMLAVPLSEEETKKLLPQELSIAVINAPQLTVVSGPTPDIESFREKLLTEKRLECRPLHTSHAFHSSMMEPILTAFTEQVASFERKAPQIPFVSNVSGAWITAEQATSPDYWANHLRQAVRFYDCVSTLLENKFKHFIEIGPGQVLSQLTKQHPDGEKSCIFTTTRRPVERKNDMAELLKGIGQLWAAGISVDWKAFYMDQSQNKLSLPTYPFQRKSFWIEAPLQSASSATITPQIRPVSGTQEDKSSEKTKIDGPRNDLELQISNIFTELLGIPKIDIRSNFFEIGGDSLLAANLLANLSKTCDGNLSLADIFENPTVESLASLITIGGGNLRSSILPLNSGKGEHLIYFVVGIHIYHALAQHLDGTASCFGTFLPAEEALFEEGAAGNDWTALDLAKAYRKEIEKHSNGRPISLVGVSFGGVVAYELARQLEEKGQHVPLLVMLDSLLPSGMQRNYLKWATAKTKGLNAKEIGRIAGKIKSKLSAKAEKIKRQAPLPPSVPDQCNSDDEAGFVPDQRLVVYADAVDRFEAMGSNTTYDGTTLLIRAQDAIRGPGYKIDPHFGWKKHITGQFLVDSAPGDHLGILKDPNVEKTANIIKGILLK